MSKVYIIYRTILVKNENFWKLWNIITLNNCIPKKEIGKLRDLHWYFLYVYIENIIKISVKNVIDIASNND